MLLFNPPQNLKDEIKSKTLLLQFIFTSLKAVDEKLHQSNKNLPQPSDSHFLQLKNDISKISLNSKHSDLHPFSNFSQHNSFSLSDSNDFNSQPSPEEEFSRFSERFVVGKEEGLRFFQSNEWRNTLDQGLRLSKEIERLVDSSPPPQLTNSGLDIQRLKEELKILEEQNNILNNDNNILRQKLDELESDNKEGEDGNLVEQYITLQFDFKQVKAENKRLNLVLKDLQRKSQHTNGSKKTQQQFFFPNSDGRNKGFSNRLIARPIKTSRDRKNKGIKKKTVSPDILNRFLKSSTASTEKRKRKFLKNSTASPNNRHRKPKKTSLERKIEQFRKIVRSVEHKTKVTRKKTKSPGKMNKLLNQKTKSQKNNLELFRGINRSNENKKKRTLISNISNIKKNDQLGKMSKSPDKDREEREETPKQSDKGIQKIKRSLKPKVNRNMFKPQHRQKKSLANREEMKRNDTNVSAEDLEIKIEGLDDDVAVDLVSKKKGFINVYSNIVKEKISRRSLLTRLPKKEQGISQNSNEVLNFKKKSEAVKEEGGERFVRKMGSLLGKKVEEEKELDESKVIVSKRFPKLKKK